jgi:serine/threonine kinase PknH
MVTFGRGARALTAACVSVAALFGMSATATADPSDNQANNDKLFALLAGGYTPADCKAGKQYAEDPFLARLGCGRNSQPGGPNSAIYSLYGNTADLNKAFGQYGASIPCTGTADQGPTAWQGGMMKCGHSFYPHTSQYMVTWTKDADLVVVNAEGPDVASLYAWWLTAR